MPLLEGSRVVEDRWITLADEAPLPADWPVIVGLARFAPGLAPRTLLGVLAGPATPPEVLVAALPYVTLVAVEFPRFRDGRGFSLARALRERYGFAGEIRAVGHVLPDQHRFLRRCGFTSVALPEGTNLAPWIAALERFGVAYQPAVADEAPLDRMRRRLQT